MYDVSLPEVVELVAPAMHVDEIFNVFVGRWRNPFAAEDYVDVFLYCPRCEEEHSSVNVSLIH